MQKNVSDTHQRIADLRKQGAGIIDAMKTIREECSLPLGEAKQLVSRHPDYQSTVALNAQLHAVAEEVLRLVAEE